MKQFSTLSKPLFAITAVILLTGQGCIKVKQAGSDGGIFRSPDAGETWVARHSLILSGGKAASIGAANITTLAFDPQDAHALYAGTVQSGLVYTYDQGATWFQPPQLAKGAVAGVAVDPKDKCTIYAVVGNQMIKSTDCSRTYRVMYADGRAQVTLTALSIDSFDSSVVWAATSNGDVLRSENFGVTWTTMRRFNDKVIGIFLYAGDTRHVYVGLGRNGLWRSLDKGATWTDVTPDKKKYKGAHEVRAAAWNTAGGESLILATKYGLFKGTEEMNIWEPLSLITAPGEATIFTVAVNPKNQNEIYYSTATEQQSTLFKSTDGGKSWVAKRAPTKRALTAIAIDPTDPRVVYAGGVSLQK